MREMNEIMEMAHRGGFSNWYGEKAQKGGWRTCLITGKKGRGAEIEEAVARQDQYEAEYLSEEEVVMGQMELIGEAESAGTVTINPEVLAPEGQDQEEDMQVMSEEDAFEGSDEEAPIVIKQERNKRDVVEIGEGRHASARLDDHLTAMAVNGKKVATMEISCEDCGDRRVIKVQDAFQVTRCVSCQKKHRNRKRAEARRIKRAEAKAVAQRAFDRQQQQD